MAIYMHYVIKYITHMKKVILIAISIICFTFCIAQNNYPIVEKNGQRYYEYTINQGEGLFAIARKFNIKQSDLHEANENLSTAIKAGDKLLIPIKKQEYNTQTEAKTTHIVEKKQTLYSISKMYNVPVDTLIALNPSAKTGIKIGEILIISKDKEIDIQQKNTESNIKNIMPTNDITHFVQKKETLFSISKKYNIAIHDLITLNPELKDGLKAGTTIIIKKDANPPKEITTIKKDTIKTIESILPPIENIDTITEIEPIIVTDSTILNIAYLLPLVAENTNDKKSIERFIEFYRGSLLALNEAKNNGLSANIFTHNLPKDKNKIDSIVQLLNNQNIDLVIGPAYSEQLDPILTYTKEKNITTIVPFSSKIDSTYYFPKLIQFNPPQDSLFVTILEKTFAHRNLQYILARFKNCKNKGNTFVNDLAHLLTINNKEYKEITIKPEYVDSLVTMVTNDTTILILGSSRINDVAPILDSLICYQLPQLQVWGFEEWGTNIIKKYPQTLYYSLFYPNETEKYRTNYKNWFGTRKQTVGVKYDLLGYDLTLLALKQSNIINNIPYLQTEPTLEFKENRWLNTKYYLLFWDNITIKKLNFEN